MPTDPLHLRLPAMLPAIATLAEAVEAWCAARGLPAAEAGRLNLMLDELITNTVTHGYRGRTEGWVEVHVSLQGEELCITLSDAAAHFDPTTCPLPALPRAGGLEAQPVGGLGIAFVRRLSSAWHYTRLAEGNRLVLKRRVGALPA